MNAFLRFFFLSVAFYSSFQLHAQTKFGLRVGANLSNIINDNYIWGSTKFKSGFQAGLSFDIGLTKSFKLQPNLLFTQKGYSIDLGANILPNESVSGYDEMRLNYIELPVNIAYQLKNFQFFTGPYLAFALGGKQEFDIERNSLNSSPFYFKGEYNMKPVFGNVTLSELGDYEHPFNATDFGISFGIGYTINNFLLNAGYSVGFVNLNVKYNDILSYDPSEYKARNKNLVFSISYYFGK